MAIGPARMPIFDHLGELRRRAVIIVVCLLCTIVVTYMVAPYLVEFLKQPISDVLKETNGNADLITTGAFEGFSLKFFVSLFCSVIMCSPIIFWEILAFFLPALRPNERKFVLPTFAAAVVLFILGVVFCYMFCLNAAFGWLVGESDSIATVLPQASDYIKYVMLFLIAFGAAFELPLIVFYLVWFNVVPYKKLRKSWRVVYVVLLVFCAMVTPDASPVTMFIMFAAMLALYELSLLCARIALGKKIKAQAEAEAAEEEED